MAEEKLDLKNSKLVIEGNEKEQNEWKKRVVDWKHNLTKEKSDRKRIYDLRRDFFEGNQAKYTNVVGFTKKEKSGHTNAVFNLAGKMVIKIYYALGNNPPHFIMKPLLKTDRPEQIRAQAEEDFTERVFWQNQFWQNGYKRGVMNQSIMGNFAVMTYPDFAKKIVRLVNVEKMENLMVGWRGDDSTEYDYTIYEEMRSVYSIEKEFGITVPAFKGGSVPGAEITSSGHNDPYATEGASRGGSVKGATQPSGKTEIPMAKLTDCWTDTHNIILINDELVQLTDHGFGFNPVDVGRNIHNPGKPWDISDLDFLMDPQVELNESMNDTRDFLRTGANTKYRAHNMPDFNPEALKTGSGQVIYTNDDEVFEPINNTVNTFPADLYMKSAEKLMHKLGVPEVTFGSGATAGVSGRARAIDFQSFVDMIVDKQQAWELVLTRVSEKIQILGNRYFRPKAGENFFNGPDGTFETREISFDWTEVMPITQSDKQVDIINKKGARMISLRTAIEESGYADPDAEIEKMKQEWADPALAPILANKGELLEGMIKAAVKAEITQRDLLGAETPAAPAEADTTSASPPTLMPEQNQERKMPMAQTGTERKFSTPQGVITEMMQNMAARR